MHRLIAYCTITISSDTCSSSWIHEYTQLRRSDVGKVHDYRVVTAMSPSWPGHCDGSMQCMKNNSTTTSMTCKSVLGTRSSFLLVKGTLVTRNKKPAACLKMYIIVSTSIVSW